MVPFSKNAQAMRSSEIRRLMALAADPSIISFSGGMPANTLFPIDVVDELYNSLSLSEKQAAMQYGPTPGYPPLLASLREYLESKGLPVDDSQGLIITTGAQQGLNLVAKVFLDPGDRVITEYPSFIGALAAFKSYGAKLKGIPMDKDGIDIARLSKALSGNSAKTKMLYLSPYFHNPAGIIYSAQRKQELIALLEGKNIVLLEDDPYCELFFDEADKPLTLPMKAMPGHTIPICYTGSFAKILGPGMRLGWLLGPREIIDKCEMAKQSADACTATFTQVLANAYLTKGKLPGYLSMLRPAYKRRAQLMLDALEKYMPKRVTWTTPKGGFFVWVTMPSKMDATAVFNEALKGGAAFVIGSAFDPEGRKNNSFRLAFSAAPEDKIAKGVEIIADAVKKCMNDMKK